MPNLLEMTQEVLSHQFSPSQYTEYVRERLNEALIKVCAETDFRENLVSIQATVPQGDNKVILTPEFQRVYTARLLNLDGSTTELTQNQVFALDRADPQPGRPDQYAIVSLGETPGIRLSPPPASDVTVEIRYFQRPRALVSDNDVPGIPTEYHSLLTYYALYKCYERENDYNSAQYHKNMWDEERHRYKGQAQYDADDYSQPSQVPGWSP